MTPFLVTCPVFLYSCTPGGSWMHSKWSCWVRQISCILCWSRSLMPMVSVAPMKSISSFSMSCLVFWAPRVRRRQCFASSLVVGSQPVARLASFSLHIQSIPFKDARGEAFHEGAIKQVVVCGHKYCKPPHEVPHIQPDNQLVSLTKHCSRLSFSGGRATVPVHIEDLGRSFPCSPVALHESRAHGE